MTNAKTKTPKLKLGQIGTNIDSIRKFYELPRADIREAYRAAGELEKIEAEAARFTELRDGLVKKYGKQTEPGRYVVQDISGFNGEMNKLSEIETDVVVQPLDISGLNGANVSPAEIRVWNECGLIKMES